MTIKEIQDLIKLVNRLDLSEFKMRDGEFELSIRTKLFGKQQKKETPAGPMIAMSPAPAVQHAPVAEVAAAPASAAQPAPDADVAEDDAGLVEVRSPIVGTFYRSTAPDKPPYVKVGDTIEVGSVVCIVEAMKLFNEIESEVAGKVVKALVEDAQPVEYDQVLFMVDPNG